jgi:hypothetical protein
MIFRNLCHINCIILIFLFVLLLNNFCSSNNKNIKPNPDNKIYELCPSCKGYGEIESLSSAPSIKGVELNENEKNVSKFFADISDGGWCLFSIFKSMKWEKNQGSAITEQDIELKDKKQESVKNDTLENIERPYVKRTVQCPRCNGIGWIKKTDDLGPEMDQYKTFNAIKNFNELNNK